jgi:hypothetical protein
MRFEVGLDEPRVVPSTRRSKEYMLVVIHMINAITRNFQSSAKSSSPSMFGVSFEHGNGGKAIVNGHPETGAPGLPSDARIQFGLLTEIAHCDQEPSLPRECATSQQELLFSLRRREASQANQVFASSRP